LVVNELLMREKCELNAMLKTLKSMESWWTQLEENDSVDTFWQWSITHCPAPAQL